MLKKTDQPIHEVISRTHLPLFDLQETDGQIKAKARFSADAIWFQGHFPSIRILPCVAVTALAVEPLLRNSLAKGRPLKIKGFSRVRIKILTFPDEPLDIAIENMPPDREAELAFEVSCRGAKVCQGKALVAEQ
ncbi:MAG: hypothetical protein JXA41_09000 [Deltaproteobacteria bacterium]|nr:hypothetical protein [Deltaproteobacteria bacterium]